MGSKTCKGGSVYKFAVGSNSSNRGHGAAELELELEKGAENGTEQPGADLKDIVAKPEWKASFQLLVGGWA